MPGYHERAKRIVNRVLPALPGAHGFYNPEGFIAAARRIGERERLHWLIFARLRAKAEGGKPHLTLPQGVPHMSSGAMAWAARELEAAQ